MMLVTILLCCARSLTSWSQGGHSSPWAGCEMWTKYLYWNPI